MAFTNLKSQSKFHVGQAVTLKKPYRLASEQKDLAVGSFGFINKVFFKGEMGASCNFYRILLRHKEEATQAITVFCDDSQIELVPEDKLKNYIDKKDLVYWVPQALPKTPANRQTYNLDTGNLSSLFGFMKYVRMAEKLMSNRKNKVGTPPVVKKK